MYDSPISFCSRQRVWVAVDEHVEHCAARHTCATADECVISEAFITPPVVDIVADRSEDAITSKPAPTCARSSAAQSVEDLDAPPVVDLSVELCCCD